MTIQYNTDRARWEAVLSRDRAAGNVFVYTVSSTGIYCRPTCPARVARRANVGFYDHASEAVAAGFRACKRCKPEVPGDQPEDAAVTAIKAFIASNNSNQRFLTLRQMADSAGLSKWHFHRTFVKVVGLTPGEWAKQQKQTTTTYIHPTTANPAGADSPFDFGDMSPFDSSVSATTPTSLGSSEDFDQLFSTEISEEDWLNMIDFDAIGQNVNWDTFQV